MGDSSSVLYGITCNHNKQTWVAFCCFLTARDDHETANNAFKEGAENSVEGTTWENRRCAGVQVSSTDAAGGLSPNFHLETKVLSTRPSTADSAQPTIAAVATASSTAVTTAPVHSRLHHMATHST